MAGGVGVVAGSREQRSAQSHTLAPPDAVFAPVRSQTAFEETVDRLGTAIKLGLLPPGSQLPAERELCGRMGIARSTLRQALTALTQSGHVFATRGRGGGTFVSDPQPPADPPSSRMLAEWRDICDQRLAVELGVAVLAAERAEPEDLEELDVSPIRSRRRSRTSPATARPTSACMSGSPRRPTRPRSCAR